MPVSVDRLRCESLENPLGIDTACPAFSWWLLDDRRGARQTAYRILAASCLESLQRDEGDLWDSGRVESDRDAHVGWDGAPLPSRSRVWWKVRVWDAKGAASPWSAPARFTVGLLTREDWSARWIGGPGQASGDDTDMVSPWLRKTFHLDGVPRNAFMYVNALGRFELYVNGHKADSDVLSPAVSQHSQRSLYRTYDVRHLLRPGTNCIALWLGRGWYWKARGIPGVEFDTPAVRAQLELDNDPESLVTIGTDTSWKVHASPVTPVVTEKGFGGERYDARKEVPGWNRPDHADAHWSSAQEREIHNHTVSAQTVQPNRILARFPARCVTPFPDGGWLVDFGTNLTGWLEFRIPAHLPEGHVISIEYSDRYANGSLDEMWQRDEVVCAGRSGELFRAHFNYHGFRYVHLTGLTTAPEPAQFEACLIHPDVDTTADFRCSVPLLNRIHDMLAYTLRCLSLGGYLVDCPTLERLGYGGDGHSSTRGACTVYDLQALYRNWHRAWLDCQKPDGDMPHTAPRPWAAGGGPVWCGFLLTTSWYLYEQYGDIRVLERSYVSSCRWLGFVEKHCEGDILKQWPDNEWRSWCLGEWASPRRRDVDAVAESVDLVNNCFRIHCYDVMSRTAKALGKQKEARSYAAKAAQLRPLVHEAFYVPESGAYAADQQVDLAMALFARIVPEGLRAAVQQRLEHNIVEQHDGHLDVGLVGHYFLMQTLIRDNRQDLILKMMTQTTFPGYGYMLEQGATTTWEHWDAMRSHIHNTYNGTLLWFYRGLAGIRSDPDAPGFRNVIVEPAILPGIDWVRAHHDCPHGRIESSWRVSGTALRVDVTLPAGCTGTLLLPKHGQGLVLENGKDASQAVGVVSVNEREGNWDVKLESGRYSLEVRPANVSE